MSGHENSYDKYLVENDQFFYDEQNSKKGAFLKQDSELYNEDDAIPGASVRVKKIDSDWQIYVNNVGATPLPMLDGVLSGLDIGQRYTETSRLEGRFQELIFWNADHSGDRTTIQTNVNDFYSIYP